MMLPPALVSAILVACTGPAPGHCRDVWLGDVTPMACVWEGQAFAAKWLDENPAYWMKSLDCRKPGEKSA